MSDTATVAVTATVSTILSILATLLVIYARPRTYEAGDFKEGADTYFSMINWFKVLYYFLPYGLFLFGIVFDGLVQKIKFFPAGFVGLLAVYLNSLIAYATGGKTQDTDLCGVPGLTKWGSDISPQNIVFTSAVLGYISTYISVKSDTFELMSAGAAWIGFGIVTIIQFGIYNFTKSCKEKAWKVGPVQIVPPLLATIWGTGIGSLFAWVFASFVNVGSGLTPSQQQTLLGGGTSGPAMAPTTDTAGAGKCSPTGDDDQFVCEAYKNGELVTSTIVE